MIAELVVRSSGARYQILSWGYLGISRSGIETFLRNRSLVTWNTISTNFLSTFNKNLEVLELDNARAPPPPPIVLAMLTISLDITVYEKLSLHLGCRLHFICAVH